MNMAASKCIQSWKQRHQEQLNEINFVYLPLTLNYFNLFDHWVFIDNFKQVFPARSRLWNKIID